MKTNAFKIAAIALTLAIGFSSCARDLETSNAINENGVLTRGTDVGEFFYTDKGEKEYFNVRKDRVIIKTTSAEEAKALCRQDVFLSDRPAHNVAYIWVFASIDPEKTSLDDLLKLPGVVDAAYGLEYEDGTLQYPTDKIYAGFKGFSPEEALGKAGLTENVVEIELCDADRKGYDVTLDVKLSDILRICRDLYESGLVTCAEPSCFMVMKSPKIQMP